MFPLKHSLPRESEDLALRGRNPRAFTIEDQQGWSVQELHRAEGRNSTLGESTQGLTCTETQHKAVPPKEAGLDVTSGLGGSPGKVGVSYSSPREY